MTREQIASMFLSAAQTFTQPRAKAKDRQRALLIMKMTEQLAEDSGFTDRDIFPLLNRRVA